MKYGKGTRMLRRLVCFALMAAMISPLEVSLSGAARAETVTVDYIERSWNGSQVVETTKTSPPCKVIDDSWGAMLKGWYVVKGANISSSYRLIVLDDAHIILCDGAKLTLREGINVEAGKTLHIYGQSGDSGELICEADTNDNAAIGSDDEAGDCGTIIIHGGKVTADTASYGDDAAGIGGGDGCNGGIVQIYGGTVTALGGARGAGIGGGDADGVGGFGGTIEIYGGTVTAVGGSNAAGIGGGESGHGGNIRIYGGNVTAQGGSTAVLGYGGAGIGGGGAGGDGGNITIVGGTIIAQGGADGAGIGSGDAGNGGFIEITGTAAEGCKIYAVGGDNGAGIGGGDADGNNKTGGRITISGGDIQAIGGVRAAGIGGGEGGGGGHITITGGKIDASAATPYSQHGGAGIGSGHRDGRTYPKQQITITGGEITTKGAAAGAGIGGGYDAEGGEISISGGTINAIGGTREVGTIYVSNDGAGIGGGEYGSGGTIRITGGNVTATGGDAGSGTGEGAGIGGGLYGPGGWIWIEGRNTVVNATSNSGSAIGNGESYSGERAYDLIHIENTAVKAFSHYGAGIGSSGLEDDLIRGDIEIINATIEAGGGNIGAAIGGSGTGGKVLIKDSVVRAIGTLGIEWSGAGIGSSNKGNPIEIEIVNSNVRAYGGGGAAGIGGGAAINGYGNGGNVTIKDSYIVAQGGMHRHGAIGMGIGGGAKDVRDFASPGTVSIVGSTAIRVSDDRTMWEYMNDIPQAEYVSNHQNYNVIIKPYFTVTYDANGGSGTVPATQSGLGGTTLQVSDPGELTKPPLVFDSWNTKADGSGTSYKPGNTFQLNNSITLYAQWVNVPVSYLDWDGSALVEKAGAEACKNYDVVTADTTTLEGGKWYVVEAETVLNNRLTVTGTGDAHLILLDDAALNAQKGISAAQNSSLGERRGLILHGQSGMTGSLTATGSEYASGIGGERGQSCGTVTVNGCNVTAAGGRFAAGIGGGGIDDPNLEGGSGGTVTVNGGTVIATGGERGAGIGGGANSVFVDWSGAGGTVIVNSGTVWATGGEAGKGIGAGGTKTVDDDLIVAVSHDAYSHTSAITEATKSSAEKREGTGSASEIKRQRYMLVEPGQREHTHDFTYSVSEDGSTIIATCGTAHCTLPGKCVKLKIVKPTKNTYSVGTGFGVSSATLSGLTAFSEATGKAVAATDIRYVGRDGTSYGESETPPENAGTYTAKITLTGVKTAEGESKTVTAFVNYEIAKANPRATAPTGTATYGQTLANVTLTNPEGNTPGTWTWVDSTESVGNVGTNVFKANFTPDDTQNFNTLTDINVAVTVEKAPNPTNVLDKANVSQNRSVDLSNNVILNGAKGTVYYRIDGDGLGCALYGSVLQASDKTGTVTVKVKVDGDANYLPLGEQSITVGIHNKPMQDIEAADVTTSYGATGAAVSATVKVPATGGGAISYAVKSGSEEYIAVDPSTGALTIKKAGTATVMVTAAETDEYARTIEFVTVTINKATPDIDPKPTGTAVYGQRLAEVPLTSPSETTPGTWTWEDDSLSVGDVGTNIFKANFTPDDPNYQSLSNVDITVTVGKAPNPAKTGGIAVVAKGGKTLDLKTKVAMNGATGTVSAAFQDPGKTQGCTLAGSVLTSGSVTGVVAVNVTVGEDEKYLPSSPQTVYVLILDKDQQIITAEDVITTVGATDAKVSAVVTYPETGGGAISYAVREGDEVYLDVDSQTGALTVKKVGTAVVVVTAAGTEEYRKAHKEVTVTITGSDYKIIAGDGQVWRKQSATGAIFTVKRSIRDEQTFGLFRSLILDGTTEVLPASYDAKAGSLVLMLEPAYLNTLPVGKYALDFRFEDGAAAATMTILEAEAPTPTPAPTDAPELPQTGDTSNVGLWAALTVLGIAAAALLLWLIRKKKP